MIRNILIILFVVLLAVNGYCQTDVQLPKKSAAEFIAGEHFPIIYSGQGKAMGAADPCTTGWCQVGFSPWAESADNRNIGIFNPQAFTVGLKVSCYGAGDSARISRAYFECAYNTTSERFWSGDSSNLFIEDGCFTHDLYGKWRFEALSNTSRQWLYPVRAMVGGYMRLIFESDISDTTVINWTLICEH